LARACRALALGEPEPERAEAAAARGATLAGPDDELDALAQVCFDVVHVGGIHRLTKIPSR